MKSPEGFSETDRRWMARALELAARAEHACRPNPMVGAVVAAGGEVLGEGFHQKAGGPHAEVEALLACRSDPRGATMYVTLEPCCHQGRTPPCTRAILDAGVARVVVATHDPYPSVAGRGIELLRQAGLDVQVGVLEREARILNDAFAWHVVTGRPMTTLKLALTLDGRIADRTGRSQWITGGEAREEVHRLRSQVDAILVGRQTAVCDDPSLTCRLEGRPGPQPLRVVLAARGGLSPDLKMLREGAERTHVFVGPDAGAADVAGLERQGAQVHRVAAPSGRIHLEEVVKRLEQEGVQRLLVEGGGQVAASFLDAGLVQRLWLFYAPILLASDGAMPAFAGSRVDRLLPDALHLRRVQVVRFGPDFRVEGFLLDPLDVWDAAL